MRYLLKACFFALLISVSGGCQTFRALELTASRYVIPPEQEAELGAQFAEQIREEVKLIDDPKVNEWVSEMGHSLLAHSPDTPQTFSFHVTADDSVNAFAIPGGYCYINKGLILTAENEAQVAAVVGHEINHVTTRHGVRSLQRALAIEQAAALAGAEGNTKLLVEAARNVGGVLAMRSFSRADEREADRLGVKAMVGAGYDPHAAARFFEKLLEIQQEAGAANGGTLSELFATHPATRERIENIRRQIQQMNLPDDLILNRPDFEDIQERLR